MREAELLNALAQAAPGIEIRMCPKHMVTVRIHYDPKVVGIGTTLMEAAIDCAHWIFDVLGDHPEYEQRFPQSWPPCEPTTNIRWPCKYEPL